MNIFSRIKTIDEISQDDWKMCYGSYFMHQGNTKAAYAYLSSLESFNKSITLKMFRALVEEGVRSKGFPSLQSLYIANIKKMVAEQGVKTQQYLDRAVELSGRYLEAIDVKINDMLANPETMSKNVGGELEKVFGIMTKYNEQMKDRGSGRVDISLEQAMQIKSEASSALKRIGEIESNSDDFGLEKKIK